MFDRELVREMLSMLDEACRRATVYAEPVNTPEDFLTASDERMRLEACGMALIGIGEQVKALEKRVPPDFFTRYSEVNWRQAKAMRDRISHDYFGINAQIVFKTVKEDLPAMRAVLATIMADLDQADPESSA